MTKTPYLNILYQYLIIFGFSLIIQGLETYIPTKHEFIASFDDGFVILIIGGIIFVVFSVFSIIGTKLLHNDKYMKSKNMSPNDIKFLRKWNSTDYIYLGFFMLLMTTFILAIRFYIMIIILIIIITLYYIFRIIITFCHNYEGIIETNNNNNTENNTENIEYQIQVEFDDQYAQQQYPYQQQYHNFQQVQPIYYPSNFDNTQFNNNNWQYQKIPLQPQLYNNYNNHNNLNN